MTTQDLIGQAIADLDAVANQQAKIQDARNLMPLWQRVKLERSRWPGAQRPPTPTELHEAAELGSRAIKIDEEIRELTDAQRSAQARGEDRARLEARQKKIDENTVKAQQLREQAQELKKVGKAKLVPTPKARDSIVPVPGAFLVDHRGELNARLLEHLPDDQVCVRPSADFLRAPVHRRVALDPRLNGRMTALDLLLECHGGPCLDCIALTKKLLTELAERAVSRELAFGGAPPAPEPAPPKSEETQLNVVADPDCIAIRNELAKGPKLLGGLGTRLRVSRRRISDYLRAMREVGLVEQTRSRGPWGLTDAGRQQHERDS